MAAYVVVAGSIGVGKSTLIKALSARLPMATAYEELREDLLGRFFNQPAQYAFRLQLGYSLQYLAQAIAISNERRLVVQDRCIWDTHYVFSRWRRDQGFIDASDFRFLERIVEVCELQRKPDLVIMLDASVQTSLLRIRARNLVEERSISAIFLQELRCYYREWFEGLSARKLLIDTDNLSAPDVLERALCELMTVSLAV